MATRSESVSANRPASGRSGRSGLPGLKEAIPAECLRDLGVPDEFGKADALAACDIFVFLPRTKRLALLTSRHGLRQACDLRFCVSACRQLIEDNVTGLWADQDPSLAKKITFSFSSLI
jgi:hypothetical protein